MTKGYILKGMERIDFQLTSQGSIINESLQAEEQLAVLRKKYSDIIWEIIDFENLKIALEQEKEEVALAFTNSSLSYKHFFESSYPDVTIISLEGKLDSVSYDGRYENIMIATIIITYIILLLRIIL